MSHRDPYVRVSHMLDFAREALNVVDGRSRADLDTDRTFNLAVVQIVSLVDYAARHIPNDFRATYPEFPWAETNYCDRAIRAYDDTDYNLVWNIIHREFPSLITQLEAIMEHSNS